MLKNINCRPILAEIADAGKQAGIFEYMFIAFGTTLGHVRPSLRKVHGEQVMSYGVIPSDDDMDIGILADRITEEQETKYFETLRSKNFFFGWSKAGTGEKIRQARRSDNGRLVWCSIKQKPEDTKCCQWFMFDYRGITWHSKGKSWITDGKFTKFKHSRESEAIAKGIPSGYLARLKLVNYIGVEFRVPELYGCCVDNWYPDWIEKRSEASVKANVLEVGKWEERKTWRIL